MKRVLFVCVENANRSQMAEAFARIHGRDVIDPSSAGSSPANRVNPKAVAAMLEKGYNLQTHVPRSLASIRPGQWDYVITMGCGDACPWVAAIHREDWEIQNPRDLPPAAFNEIRDEIERRVIDLIARIRTENNPPGHGHD